MTTEKAKQARKLNVLKAQDKLAELRREGKNTYTSNCLVTLAKRPGNLRRAINGMCFACIGGTIDKLPAPGWQKRIAFCTTATCPLYWCRPFAAKFHPGTDEEDVK